ncbi:MAG: HAMP domain-containing sensor histidine kinase [Saprospiraceae bacterium]|nr:HAMP domain-containing histidine kinase [Saprospiraceae bacterium]
MKEKLSFGLMVLSICGLTTFLCLWLRKSFQEEKENLKTALAFQVVKASSELKDSLIFNYQINDSLKQIKTLVKHRIGSTLGDSIGSLVERQFIRKSSKRNGSDSSSIKLKHAIIIDTTFILSENRAVESDGLAAIDWQSMLNDTSKNRSKTIKIIASIDTMVNNQDLNLFLNSPNFAFKQDSLNDYDQSTWSIIKLIWPQILFSIILLSAVCLAFWFFYKSNDELHQLNEIKSNFISNMTHELKTPIATVSVAIEALQNFETQNDRKRTIEYLGIAQNELGRLGLLVDKVMNFNQLELNQDLFHFEDVDLSIILDQVLSSMSLQLSSVDVDLSIEKIGSAFHVKGDSLHLTNAILNLMDNAIKYGGPSPKINMKLEEKNHHVVFSIKEFGIGIPEMYINKVFDKFFRVPTGDLHTYKGHGLGLSYVQQVISKHGGQITVQSKEGFGSTFTIKLPKNG